MFVEIIFGKKIFDICFIFYGRIKLVVDWFFRLENDY